MRKLQKVIGVRFKKAGRIHFYNPSTFNIEKGDTVIIDTPHGPEYGQVVISPREIVENKHKIPIINRKANQDDLILIAENHRKEAEAFDICIEKISEHGLPMNLISVEYTFDLSKIVFSFTSNGRVDFRELVKDLASIFRTRIELRQVGVRDEAKLLGGMGGCGRPLCCATFLGDFIPVSIRMAKDQSLSLNPSKISGICGRLMCCLKYENDYYCENCPHESSMTVMKDFKLGARVIIDEGEGKIISLNRQRRTATIILDNSKTAIASWDNIFEAEDDDEDVKTIVANVGEEEEQTSEEDSSSIIIDNKDTDNINDKFTNRNRRNEKFSTKSYSPPQKFKSNYQHSGKFNTNSQNKFSFHNKETQENRDTRDNKVNKKFYKNDRNDRRNEDYHRNRKPR